jgi:hypothetical protein
MQPLLHSLLRWRRQPKKDLFSSNFKSPISNLRLNLYRIHCPGGGGNISDGDNDCGGHRQNQLKWHQMKWQMWPVVVTAAAIATILTIITATMAEVAGSGDGGSKSCDGSGGFGGGKGGGSNGNGSNNDGGESDGGDNDGSNSDSNRRQWGR